MSVSAFRPRRSVLYMPASNGRALEKARTIPCDALILDLEDAVAPEAKPAARDAACAAVRSGGYGRRELTIRINAAATEWHEADLAAACAAGPDAVVVPKVESAEAVRAGRRDGQARCAGPDRAVGDGGDAHRDARRAGDRRGLPAAVGARHGHQRPRQGAVRGARPGPAPAAARPRPRTAGRSRDRPRDHRRRLQRCPRRRGVPGRVRPGPRDGLRRQDADPPGAGRGCQRGVRAVGRRRSRTLAGSWPPGRAAAARAS